MDRAWDVELYFNFHLFKLDTLELTNKYNNSYGNKIRKFEDSNID